MLSARLHLLGYGNRILNAERDIVSVEQQHAVVGHGMCKRAEGFKLRVKRHNPGMRVGAKNGNIVYFAC